MQGLTQFLGKGVTHGPWTVRQFGPPCLGKASRRAALVTLLGAALLRHDPTGVLAKGRGKVKSQAKAKAKVKVCNPGTRCTPGKGRNTSGCDFSGSTAFFAGDFRGSNLSNSNFTGAHLAEADFRGANLSGACLVGTDLQGSQARRLGQPGRGHFLPHPHAGWIVQRPRL